MIAKAYRFHGHGGVRYVYRTGKTARISGLSIKYSPSKKNNSRLAVVVSKKVTKSAPMRNRIRRRLYEQMRLHWSLIKEPIDMVITVFDQSLAEVPPAKLGSQLRELLKQADILN